MVAAQPPSLVTHVSRLWFHPPFLKELKKRDREITLVEGLQKCFDLLFSNPRTPGLNLETIEQIGRHRLLSARINQACRVILVQHSSNELGALYFSSDHDAAYHWVVRHKSTLPTQLSRDLEYVRGSLIANYLGGMPIIQFDEDSPLALRSAEQFREMIRDGLARYLAYLDPDQQWLVKMNVSGLLLVKGGAGTGKTSVAVHRLKALADQPALPGLGPERVLYLCYNTLLARTVGQMLSVLYGDDLPPTVEVKTFHTWCAEYLAATGAVLPQIDDGRCQQAVFKAFGQLSKEQRATLGKLDGRFVDVEIVQVIKHNGLTTKQQYLDFDREKRGISLKKPAREVIWELYERASQEEQRQGIGRYCDLPLLALRALEQAELPPHYRGIVIDEGQDCSPVMIRLARRLLVGIKGPLAVFADPAQGIYECGFHWTQKELRPAGGNVRRLKKTYRTTHQIYTLSQSLLDDSDELREDREEMEPPTRHGPRPCLVVAFDVEELHEEFVRRIHQELSRRPAQQIGILAGRWEALRRFEHLLRLQGIPVSPAERGTINLQDDAVKLLTMHSAKGIDFPCVFILGPFNTDLGGERQLDRAETRRILYVALTRASESVTIGIVQGKHHPLVEELDSEHYDVAGSCGKSFVNLRGVRQGSDGSIGFVGRG
jgi:superfamily I DNA/RNA helicase